MKAQWITLHETEADTGSSDTIVLTEDDASWLSEVLASRLDGSARG